MSGFKNLHPICSFSYFAIAIILVLVCQTPVAMVEALAGAVFFLHCTEAPSLSFANAFADCICKPAFESQRCDKTCENHEPMGDSGSVVLWNHGGTVFGCADFMVWMLSGSDHQ